MLESRRLGEIVRFALVGASATLLYVILAFAFSKALVGWPSAFSALGAYSAAGLYSYLAHKFFTFGSDGDHGREAPRFVAVGIAGFALAALLPFILHDVLELAFVVPVLLTAILVPVMNFAALRWFVFGRAASGTDRTA